MSEQHEVFAKAASPGGQPRRVFAGDEEAARRYVADNFPRLHVEPGVDYGDQPPEPDAVLVNPGGNVRDGSGVEHFVGGKWQDPNQQDDADGDGDGDGDDGDGYDHSGKSVKELKTDLDDRGLSTSGNKAELQQRLVDHDNEQDAEV